MLPALFDTSIYVSALRRRDAGPAVARFVAENDIWLSAVVLEELYAGARERDRHVVELLENHFDEESRILLPDLDDWIQAGKVLSRLAAKYDYEKIGRNRLTNDALMAMSAARAGVTVVTANVRDFRRLAEFRTFSWQVVTI
ncbi:MAG: type II toxin-antitoxin system VapC family toxin [Candidatus Sulfotelmatobacter sp.]